MKMGQDIFNGLKSLQLALCAAISFSQYSEFINVNN